MICGICKTDNSEEAQFCSNCGHALGEANFFGSTESPQVELPMVRFPEALSLAFHQYFTFRGRARRSEYWWFALFQVLLGFVGIVPVIGAIISFFGWLICLIPAISLTSRRLHDIGKTGWWQLVIWILTTIGWVSTTALAIIAGIAWSEDGDASVFGMLAVATVAFILTIGVTLLFIVWMVRKGDQGPNKYGPDPRQYVATVPS